MASAQPGVWGIDLGQCALKAVRLTVLEQEVVATAFDYIEHPKILSQPDADPDQLVRDALQLFLSRNQVRGDQIAISVPGQTGLARFVKLPPVEAKKIPDIVRFEAKQQIPFPLEEVVWDWQTINKPTEIEGFVENEIGLFAMKRDMIQRALQPLQEVKAEVHYVQMSPLALCNYAMFDLLNAGALDGKVQVAPVEPEEGLGERNACVVVLEIGADNSNLVVTDGDRIIWQRPIPIGGNHFTRAIAKEMKLTFAKAEHLKRHATKAEDPKKIFASMRPVFSDFVGELQRSLGFFTNTHRQATIKKIVGLGNAFKLPGLQKFISQTMGLELEKIASFRRLKGDEVIHAPVFAENILSFAVAYGLALQGLGLTRLQTNLLPREIQVDRIIRAKKPWVAAAAACMLLGVTAFSIRAGGEYKVSDEAKAAAKKAEAVIKRHEDYQRRFQEQQETLVKARESAAAMMRGGQERVNWAMVLRYINESLPQPNGYNLPARWIGERLDANCALAKYWNEDAQRAAERLRERDQEGLKDEIDLSHLVQINLQAVWARYCDPPMLTSWFNNVRKDAQEQDLLRHSDWKKAPDKPGWVLEVRGYSYHRGGLRFIMDTFAENLRTGKPRWDPSRNSWVWEKGVVVPLNDPSGRWRKLDISHVAIYAYDSVKLTPNNAPGFKLISGGLFLNALVRGQAGGTGSGLGAGGGTAGMGTAPPPMGGAAGSSAAAPGGGPDGAGGGGGTTTRNRGDWVGLGSSAGATGGIGGVGGTGLGGGGNMGLPDLPGGGLPGGGSGTASGGVQDAQVLKSGERLRTEFVIVFYWHEPLPTEPDPKGGYEEANQGDLAGGMMGGSGPPPGYPGYPAGPSGPPAGGPASSGGGGDSGWGRRLPGIDD
jgi:type IV pilus assembly protein PilM